MIREMIGRKMQGGLESLQGSLRSALEKLGPPTAEQKKEEREAARYQRFLDSLHAEFDAIKGLEKEYSGLRYHLADTRMTIPIVSANEPLLKKPKGLKPAFEKAGAFVESVWNTFNELRFGAHGFEVVERSSLLGKDLGFSETVRPFGYSDFAALEMSVSDVRAKLDRYCDAQKLPKPQQAQAAQSENPASQEVPPEIRKEPETPPFAGVDI